MTGEGVISVSLRAAVVAAIGSIAFFAARPSDVHAWGPYNNLDPEFCDSVTVRGNPAELERLPRLRQPPASEQLPFLPNTLQFSANDAFQVGEGTLGFSLRQSDGHRTEDLGLTAKAMLVRISRRGKVRKAVGRFQEKLSTLKGFETLPLSFEVAQPGLYRAKVVFEDKSGRLLSHYGAYFRLLPLRIQPPRLALNARTFNPGEQILARVENFSRESVSYGAPYRIDRWDGSDWVKASESPDGPWKRILFVAPPGITGRCSAFPIPASMEPGIYRFLVPGTRYPPRPPSGYSVGPRPIILTARFEIVPTP